MSTDRIARPACGCRVSTRRTAETRVSPWERRLFTISLPVKPFTPKTVTFIAILRLWGVWRKKGEGESRVQYNVCLVCEKSRCCETELTTELVEIGTRWQIRSRCKVFRCFYIEILEQISGDSVVPVPCKRAEWIHTDIDILPFPENSCRLTKMCHAVHDTVMVMSTSLTLSSA